MIKRNRSTKKLYAFASLITLLFLLSVLSPLLPIQDPNRIDLEALKKPPSLEHPFGTDNKGRDVFSRVIHGARISIGVAIAAAFISAFIGFTVGLCSGYFGGKVDALLMSVVDFLLSFPSLLLAIAISVILPPGIYTVMIAISAVGWTSFARLIRGNVLTIKNMPYIESAKALGCSNFRIISLHIAPMCIPLGLVMIGIKLGGYILTEATLSFLGLGAQPPIPTWGSMISSSRAYILSAPWMVLFPGFFITTTAFCFNVIGSMLEDVHNLSFNRNKREY